MAIIVNDNVKIQAPKPSDSRYYNELVPWASIAEANAAIEPTVRFKGLTVNINNEEYYYKNGILDTDLIQKTPTSARVITGYGTPIGAVTPLGIGERFIDLMGPTIYTAYGLTANDRIS